MKYTETGQYLTLQRLNSFSFVHCPFIVFALFSHLFTGHVRMCTYIRPPNHPRSPYDTTGTSSYVHKILKYWHFPFMFRLLQSWRKRDVIFIFRIRTEAQQVQKKATRWADEFEMKSSSDYYKLNTKHARRPRQNHLGRQEVLFNTHPWKKCDRLLPWSLHYHS